MKQTTAETPSIDDFEISDKDIEDIGLQLAELSSFTQFINFIKGLPSYTKVLFTSAILLVTLILLADVINSYVGNPTYSRTPGISTSSDPNGLKAYSLLLNSYNISTVSLALRPQYSHLKTGSTLIIDNGINPNSTNEFQYLYNFVSSGGTLVLCTESQTNETVNGILKYNTSGIDSAQIFHLSNQITEARPTVQAKNLLPGVSSINFGQFAFGLSDNRYFPFRPILLGSQGIGGLYLKINQGKLVVLADYSPLTNQLLNSQDNAAFGIDLGRSQTNTVYFDDADALQTTQSEFVMPSRFENFALILLIIGLLYILSKIFRLGPPIKTKIVSTDPRMAHVDALTAKILKSQNSYELIDRLHAELNAKIIRLDEINATFKDFDKMTFDEIMVLATNLNYSDQYLIDITNALVAINSYLKTFRSDY